jgi:hypothetical protein
MLRWFPNSELLLHASHAALPILKSSKLPPVLDAADLSVFQIIDKTIRNSKFRRPSEATPYHHNVFTFIPIVKIVNYTIHKQSRLSAVFLSPTVNAVLLLKFHVSLHASYTALPILTTKLRRSIASSMAFQSTVLMSEFWFVIDCNNTLFNVCPCSTFYFYPLHFRYSYLLLNIRLPERRADTAWGPL